MCGIAACILKNGKAAPILLGCVKRLEYRGYDSVGIATLNSSIIVEKDEGKINDFEESLDLSKFQGRIGIGHVRWATHGPPTVSKKTVVRPRNMAARRRFEKPEKRLSPFHYK